MLLVATILDSTDMNFHHCRETELPDSKDFHSVWKGINTYIFPKPGSIYQGHVKEMGLMCAYGVSVCSVEAKPAGTLKSQDVGERL